MKLNGIVGKGSGRLGSAVFTVRGGEQIVRQYTPNVSNPNTDAQRTQRAKFKLLSQMAVIAANGLLFPKVGNVSRRNAFVSANMDAVTFSSDRASLDISSLKLGKGFAPVEITRTNLTEADNVTIEIVGEGWDGIAYATVDALDNGHVVGISGVVSTTGTSIPIIGARIARTQIVAAAWRFRDGATRAKYGNLINSSTGQATTNVAIILTELVASGEIEVSQTVVPKTNA